LFLTQDAGASWRHIDTLAAYHIVDVAFAGAQASNASVVIATSLRDAGTSVSNNRGGIWRSADGGNSWDHINPLPGCLAAASGGGIVFGPANQVVVATECGLMSSSDLGVTWSNLLPKSLAGVVVAPNTAIDVCIQGGGHQRSVDGGQTWSAVHNGPDCATAHALDVSPLDGQVLFATEGADLFESDDGGTTWTIDLHATAFNERPVWVRTHAAIDQDPNHFDLYYPGRRVTCGNTAGVQRCPSNAGEVWSRMPDTPLNHDIDGIAFDPLGACPLLMVADYGAYRSTSFSSPCTASAAWSDWGTAANGLGALEIYSVNGQLRGSSTVLFFGTQDNGIWVNNDATTNGWQYFGIEGSFLQSIPRASNGPPSESQITYHDFERGDIRVVPNGTVFQSGPGSAWTSASPPGNTDAPFPISANRYVQWSDKTLFLTQDGGSSWSQLAVLPAGLPADLDVAPFGGLQLTRTASGPALFSFLGDSLGSGLALLTDLSPASMPRTLDVRSLNGTNSAGSASGMKNIFGDCFIRAFYCQPVFAVDPNDFHKLIVADGIQEQMLLSVDAGSTWKPLSTLTSLVTVGGLLSFHRSSMDSQVHTIVFDPGDSAHVLVGTDEAGIFASKDGGANWIAVPGTTAATSISSIFFDDRNGAVYVGSYGRGLWRLLVDWNSF
jgi:photosystem II stability/assembly factor-like uncharacterized protein